MYHNPNVRKINILYHEFYDNRQFYSKIDIHNYKASVIILYSYLNIMMLNEVQVYVRRRKSFSSLSAIPIQFHPSLLLIQFGSLKTIKGKIDT